MYRACKIMNKDEYPIGGADPIMVPLRVSTLDPIAEKLHSNTALTWRETHSLLYFISHQTRLFLRQELEAPLKERTVQFNDPNPDIFKNTLNGACNGAALFSTILAYKLGIKDHRLLHTRCSFYTDLPVFDHAFSVLGLPILDKEGHQKTHLFVIDTTYRQFLNPDINDFFNSVDKKATLDFPSYALTDHLLKFGFIYMGKGAHKTYHHNFLSIPLNWQEADYSDFIKKEGQTLSACFNHPFIGPYLKALEYNTPTTPSKFSLPRIKPWGGLYAV